LVLDLAPPTSGARGQEPNQGWDGDEKRREIKKEGRNQEKEMKKGEEWGRK
jgi:hypothetical protein